MSSVYSLPPARGPVVVVLYAYWKRSAFEPALEARATGHIDELEKKAGRQTVIRETDRFIVPRIVGDQERRSIRDEAPRLFCKIGAP
jgi:hypothetical protein